MNIYVGNLSRDVTDEDLRKTFESFGSVESATVIKEKSSGESRGFGFVEMPTESEARSAISGLNSKELKGRTLSVSEARPRTERTRRREPGRGRGRGKPPGRRRY